MLPCLLWTLDAPPARAQWAGTTLIEKGHAEHEADSYTIQVGRFQDEIKALELAHDLRAKGYPPYVLASLGLNKTIWFSVRLGTYNGMAEASKEAALFKEKEGREAIVVISGTTPPEKEKQGFYFLQVGAFIDHDNAVKRVEDYKGKGYQPGILLLKDKKKDPWFIVYLQTYETLDDAQKAASAFREKEGQECYINAISPELFKQRVNKGE